MLNSRDFCWSANENEKSEFQREKLGKQIWERKYDA